jgi:hypothetical protein
VEKCHFGARTSSAVFCRCGALQFTVSYCPKPEGEESSPVRHTARFAVNGTQVQQTTVRGAISVFKAESSFVSKKRSEAVGRLRSSSIDLPRVDREPCLRDYCTVRLALLALNASARYNLHAQFSSDSVQLTKRGGKCCQAGVNKRSIDRKRRARHGLPLKAGRERCCNSLDDAQVLEFSADCKCRPM